MSYFWEQGQAKGDVGVVWKRQLSEWMRGRETFSRIEVTQTRTFIYGGSSHVVETQCCVHIIHVLKESKEVFHFLKCDSLQRRKTWNMNQTKCRKSEGNYLLQCDKRVKFSLGSCRKCVICYHDNDISGVSQICDALHMDEQWAGINRVTSCLRHRDTACGHNTDGPSSKNVSFIPWNFPEIV